MIYGVPIEAIGFTVSALGKLLVSYTAVRVHFRFWQEHQIDEQVFRTMKSEQRLGILGIALIAIGYLIELPTKL
jgi:hypothetical protein